MTAAIITAAYAWYIYCALATSNDRGQLINFIFSDPGRIDWRTDNLEYQKVPYMRHFFQVLTFRDPRLLYPYRLRGAIPDRMSISRLVLIVFLCVAVVAIWSARASACTIATGQSQSRGPDGTPDVMVSGVGDVWITHNGVTRRLPTRDAPCEDAASLRGSIDADLRGARQLYDRR